MSVPVVQDAMVPPAAADVKANTSPVAVYLARLASGSRRGQLDALNMIARLLTKGSADAEGVNWASLKYPQTAAIRAALTERYAPNTTKRMLAALRGVLKECWRLGLMVHDEYARAADIAPVRGQLPPRGRALNEGAAKGTQVQPVYVILPFGDCCMALGCVGPKPLSARLLPTADRERGDRTEFDDPSL